MLHNLIGRIAMHKSFDVVRAGAAEAYLNDPDFKLYVDLTLGGRFVEIKEQAFLAYSKTTTFCPKGADVIGWREMLKEIASYQDGSPMKARVRISKIVAGLDHVDRDDARLLVEGLFRNKLPFPPLALMDVLGDQVVPKG